MAVNRVDFGGKTLIDLTGDSLESAEQLLKGDYRPCTGWERDNRADGGGGRRRC